MHRAFVSWLAESNGKAVFTRAVLTGSCDVCKAVLALALSLPSACCVRTLLIAFWLALLSPGNLQLMAELKLSMYKLSRWQTCPRTWHSTQQNILEWPCIALLLGCTMVWERLSYKTFLCLTKASFSIESEKVLIFLIKKSSFTFRQ